MKKIQRSDCPFRVHTLGAQLADSEAWTSKMFTVRFTLTFLAICDIFQSMYEGCCAKFTQNGGLRRELLQTVGAVLVNCDQRDLDWGVGLRLTDKRVATPSEWRGRNLLGECLMAVRAAVAMDYPSEISVVFPSKWR